MMGGNLRPLIGLLLGVAACSGPAVGGDVVAGTDGGSSVGPEAGLGAADRGLATILRGFGLTILRDGGGGSAWRVATTGLGTRSGGGGPGPAWSWTAPTCASAAARGGSPTWSCSW